MGRKIIVILIFALSVGPAVAYTINDLQVVRYGARYLVTFNANIDASKEAVKSVIFNFEEASKLSPALLRTEVYRYDDDTARVTAVLRPCLYLFCKTMSKVSIVNLEENDISFTGIRDAGSFRDTLERIKLSSKNENTTNFKYNGTLSPKFYMPSWLGVKFVRGVIRKYLDGMLENIESKASSVS